MRSIYLALTSIVAIWPFSQTVFGSVTVYEGQSAFYKSQSPGAKENASDCLCNVTADDELSTFVLAVGLEGFVWRMTIGVNGPTPYIAVYDWRGGAKDAMIFPEEADWRTHGIVRTAGEIQYIFEPIPIIVQPSVLANYFRIVSGGDPETDRKIQFRGRRNSASETIPAKTFPELPIEIRRDRIGGPIVKASYIDSKGEAAGFEYHFAYSEGEAFPTTSSLFVTRGQNRHRMGTLVVERVTTHTGELKDFAPWLPGMTVLDERNYVGVAKSYTYEGPARETGVVAPTSPVAAVAESKPKSKGPAKQPSWSLDLRSGAIALGIIGSGLLIIGGQMLLRRRNR